MIRKAFASMGRIAANTLVAVATLALAGALLSRADYTLTQGAGTTVFAFTCFTTKVCPAHVPIDSTGTSTNNFVGNNSDGVATSSSGLPPVNAYLNLFNGSTWDRAQGLTAGTFGSPSTQVLSVQANDPCFYGNKSSASISISSATTPQFVALSGSTVVYVCGFSVSIAPSATSADTIQFIYGTGSNCGTGATALTGTYGNGDLTTSAPPLPITYGGGAQTVFKGAAGNAICGVAAGTTVNVQGVLTYVQQ